MAQSNGGLELKKELIEKIDKLYPSPSERASHVWGILQQHAANLSTWDVLCFCAEYMGMMIPAVPFIEKGAKDNARLIYDAHYFFPESVNAAESGIPRAVEPQHPSREPERESESQRTGPFAARFDFR